MIIVYLIYDTDSLLACSSTCYLWYSTTGPHLHHTLTTDDWVIPSQYQRLRWPVPLQKSYDFGLVPCVKQFWIRTEHSEFGPNWFDRYTLCYFSAFTDLRELGIDNLQTSGFVSNSQWYFGRLSLTLRFLTLDSPGVPVFHQTLPEPPRARSIDHCPGWEGKWPVSASVHLECNTEESVVLTQGWRHPLTGCQPGRPRLKDLRGEHSQDVMIFTVFPPFFLL